MVLLDLLLHYLSQPKCLRPRSQLPRLKDHLQVPIFLFLNTILRSQLSGGGHHIVSIFLVINLPN